MTLKSTAFETIIALANTLTDNVLMYSVNAKFLKLRPVLMGTKLAVDFTNNYKSVASTSMYTINKGFADTLLYNGISDHRNFNIQIAYTLGANLHGEEGMSNQLKPLHYAAMCSNLDAVEFMKNHDVNINEVVKVNQEQHRWFYNEVILPRISEILEFFGYEKLKERGTNILHIAAAAGNKDLYNALIELGADQNAIDQNGNKPAYYFENNKNAPVLKDPNMSTSLAEKLLHLQDLLMQALNFANAVRNNGFDADQSSSVPTLPQIAYPSNISILDMDTGQELSKCR